DGRTSRGAEAAGGGDAVHAGHLDVADDDVDVLPGGVAGGRAVGTLRHDGDVGESVEDGAQAGADDRVVVDEHDADHEGSFSEVRGMWTVAAVPSPGPSDSMSSSPPTAATRDSRPRRPYPCPPVKPHPSSMTSRVTSVSHTA